MKRLILGILELDAVAGRRRSAATAKVGVSCEEEDGEEERNGWSGGGNCRSWRRCGLVSADKAESCQEWICR